MASSRDSMWPEAVLQPHITPGHEEGAGPPRLPKLCRAYLHAVGAVCLGALCALGIPLILRAWDSHI